MRYEREETSMGLTQQRQKPRRLFLPLTCSDLEGRASPRGRIRVRDGSPLSAAYDSITQRGSGGSRRLQNNAWHCSSFLVQAGLWDLISLISLRAHHFGVARGPSDNGVICARWLMPHVGSAACLRSHLFASQNTAHSWQRCHAGGRKTSANNQTNPYPEFRPL